MKDEVNYNECDCPKYIIFVKIIYDFQKIISVTFNKGLKQRSQADLIPGSMVLALCDKGSYKIVPMV